MHREKLYQDDRFPVVAHRHRLQVGPYSIRYEELAEAFRVAHGDVDIRRLLREGREGNGVSQKEVGAVAGVDQGFITAFELGKRNFSPRLVRGYAEALGRSEGYVLALAVATYFRDTYMSEPPRERRRYRPQRRE